MKILNRSSPKPNRTKFQITSLMKSFKKLYFSWQILNIERTNNNVIQLLSKYDNMITYFFSMCNRQYFNCSTFYFTFYFRDDFNFHITNFPFLSSNIPSSPAYGVFISQLIRYARACSSYECFILRARRLASKLLKQGYIVERLKSSFRKFYGRYGDLVEQYGVTLSRMLNDILTLDQQ